MKIINNIYEEGANYEAFDNTTYKTAAACIKHEIEKLDSMPEYRGIYDEVVGNIKNVGIMPGKEELPAICFLTNNLVQLACLGKYLMNEKHGCTAEEIFAAGDVLANNLGFRYVMWFEEGAKKKTAIKLERFDNIQLDLHDRANALAALQRKNAKIINK